MYKCEVRKETWEANSSSFIKERERNVYRESGACLKEREREKGRT